jgi:hypothetical protein
VSSAAAAQQASALVTLPLVLVAYTVARGTLFRTEAAGFGIGSLAWLGAGVAVARFPGGATRAPARHGGLTRPGRATVRSADPAPVVAGGVPGREGRAASRVASTL